MYQDWIEDAVNVIINFEKLCAQKEEIERRIGIMQAMAKDLIEDGVDNYYNRRIFPEGRKHFNRFLYKLIKIVKDKRPNNYAELNGVV